ncbi:hypothetical protein WICMUC_001397 [Wickerhamomyces mucosus]|uniref:Uncharacterized protein n=1 Tax=Wickerhamomyces mucosus TaxID=1378264 RepID=A0A9P8TH25_9ASCO|nr:hypothetical protein WICMUC_001397 [Wickerhamomyces mucosus]
MYLEFNTINISAIHTDLPSKFELQLAFILDPEKCLAHQISFYISERSYTELRTISSSSSFLSACKIATTEFSRLEELVSTCSINLLDLSSLESSNPSSPIGSTDEINSVDSIYGLKTLTTLKSTLTVYGDSGDLSIP